ncbi:unnamed protein product, partial [Effrenium voratum]
SKDQLPCHLEQSLSYLLIAAQDSGRRWDGSILQLCPTYALKWKEQQGLHAEGTSNWSVRWPVMKDIILRGNFDVLCLQEVESTEADAIAADLGPDYVTRYFKHPPKRPPDGVMIAVKKSCCKAAPSWSEHDYKGFVIFGGAEFQHHSGARVRVANGHMRGFNQEQLREFGAFGTSGTWDLQILTAWRRVRGEKIGGKKSGSA